MDLNFAVTHGVWCASVCLSLVMDAVSSHREDLRVHLIVKHYTAFGACDALPSQYVHPINVIPVVCHQF